MSRSLSSTSKSSPRPSWPKLFTQLKTGRDSQRTPLEYINPNKFIKGSKSLVWRWAVLEDNSGNRFFFILFFFSPPHPYYWQTVQVIVAPVATYTRWVSPCSSVKCHLCQEHEEILWFCFPYSCWWLNVKNFPHLCDQMEL